MFIFLPLPFVSSKIFCSFFFFYLAASPAKVISVTEFNLLICFSWWKLVLNCWSKIIKKRENIWSVHHIKNLFCSQGALGKSRRTQTPLKDTQCSVCSQTGCPCPAPVSASPQKNEILTNCSRIMKDLWEWFEAWNICQWARWIKKCILINSAERAGWEAACSPFLVAS